MASSSYDYDYNYVLRLERFCRENNFPQPHYEYFRYPESFIDILNCCGKVDEYTIVEDAATTDEAKNLVAKSLLALITSKVHLQGDPTEFLNKVCEIHGLPKPGYVTNHLPQIDIYIVDGTIATTPSVVTTAYGPSAKDTKQRASRKLLLAIQKDIVNTPAVNTGLNP